MADFNLPSLTSTYTDVIDLFNNKIAENAKMFDGTTYTNLPTGTIKWNSSNNRFEKWDGSAWNVLTSTYQINVATLEGHASSYFLPASSYTASDVLSKIKTVDGSGSGLDADTLDGINSTQFLRGDYTAGLVTITDTTTMANWARGESHMVNVSGSDAGATPNKGDSYYYITRTASRDTSGGYSCIAIGYSSGGLYTGRAADSTVYPSWVTVWTATTDGSGSGLDADKWHGGTQSTSTSAPSGGADGDFWFQY